MAQDSPRTHSSRTESPRTDAPQPLHRQQMAAPQSSLGDRLNNTSSVNSEHNSVLVSPVLVASAVIGMIVAISFVTIIVGSLRKNSQGGGQRHRQENEESEADSEESPYWSQGMRYSCSLMGDWSPAADLTPGDEVNTVALGDLFMDAPPCYEECMGPGATQLYLPTDAPPPYSMTDNNPSGQQDGLCTTSMDDPPTYEAACEACPPTSLLPLPGPEPGPRRPQGSPKRIV